MTVRRVPVPVDTLSPHGATNAYLVGRSGAVLVDPPARTPDLDRAADRRGVDHVLVTHAHPDHVGAVADYAASFDATVWAHARNVEQFERATGVAPDRTLREGTTLESGDGTLVTALETPGHATDHLAFAVGDAVLVGDLVVAEGSVFVGGDGGDLRAYLVSLRRLHARDTRVLYPGHGPVIEDPRAEVARLVAHRLDRERRVLAAVRDGARSLDEVLDAAYEKDVSGAREYAALTVAAHLDKLAVEGAVDWDGERARPA